MNKKKLIEELNAEIERLKQLENLNYKQDYLRTRLLAIYSRRLEEEKLS